MRLEWLVVVGVMDAIFELFLERVHGVQENTADKVNTESQDSALSD